MYTYEGQANSFLANTGTRIEKYYTGMNKYFSGDKETRPTWSITISNKNGSLTFRFGDSLQVKKDWMHLSINQLKRKYRSRKVYFVGNKTVIEPSNYDLLATLDPFFYEYNLDDFMTEYGYTSALEAIDILKEIKRQSEALKLMFYENELKQLADII